MSFFEVTRLANIAKSIINPATEDKQDTQILNTGPNGLPISKGSIAGVTYIHKFGQAPDFDTADNNVTIWDGANDAAAWQQMTYTYSATANIDRLSSTSAADTFAVEVQGLDTNYDLTVQTITLTGQTAVALTTSLRRVFRLKNVGTADNVGTIFCFVNVATTSGVPDTAANIRAIIQPGNNQTLMAIYTIPNGKTGYLRSWYAGTSGASKTSNYPVKLKVRPYGQVFQLKHISSVSDSGSSRIQHQYTEPERYEAKSDIEMRVSMTATGGIEGSVSGGFDLVLIDD